MPGKRGNQQPGGSAQGQRGNQQPKGSAQGQRGNQQPKGSAQGQRGNQQPGGSAQGQRGNQQPGGSAQGQRGNQQPKGSAQGQRGNQQPGGSAQGQRGNQQPKGSVQGQRGNQQPKGSAQGQRGNQQPKGSVQGQRGNQQPKGSVQGQRGNQQPKGSAQGQRGNQQPGGSAQGQRGNQQPGGSAQGQRGNQQPKGSAQGQRGNQQPGGSAQGQRGNQQPGGSVQGQRGNQKPGGSAQGQRGNQQPGGSVQGQRGNQQPGGSAQSHDQLQKQKNLGSSMPPNPNARATQKGSTPPKSESQGRKKETVQQPQIKSDRMNRDSDVNAMGRAFHDKYAKAPPQRSKTEDFPIVNKVTDTILIGLREKDLATRKIGVGSAFEKTNIPGKSDHDVVFSKRDPELQVSRSSQAPRGYVSLHGKDGKEVSAKEFMDRRKGLVQKTLNDSAGLDNYSTTVRQHGPALQVDVKDKKTGKIVPIDVVPGIETKDGSTYVAKPVRKQSGKADSEMFFKKSQSYEARKKFETIDKDNGCHREAFRTSKAIRNREPNLQHVTSYQLKNAVFELSDKTDDTQWSRDHIGERTQDVFKHVAKDYRKGRASDYFDPRVNLLRDTNEATRINTANRLDKLAANPDKLFAMNDKPRPVVSEQSDGSQCNIQ